jgi:hypothetical protein
VDVVRRLLHPDVVKCLVRNSSLVEYLQNSVDEVTQKAQKEKDTYLAHIKQIRRHWNQMDAAFETKIRELEQLKKSAEQEHKEAIIQHRQANNAHEQRHKKAVDQQKRERNEQKVRQEQQESLLEEKRAAMNNMRAMYEESRSHEATRHETALREQRAEAEGVLREVLATRTPRTLAAVVTQARQLVDLELHELKKEVQREQFRLARAEGAAEMRLCDICYDHDRDTSFGCGHLACGQCADGLQNCHLCQALITSRGPIFM